MTVRACLFVGVERETIVEDDLLLPGVPAVGNVLHVPAGDGAPLRLIVRRVEMLGVASGESAGKAPSLHIYCDEPRQLRARAAE